MFNENSSKKPTYKRILLKLSGEALGGKSGQGLESDTLSSVCEEIKEIHSLGAELAIVVGGGNIFRGIQAFAKGIDRTIADNMGMMATIINSLALQDVLENLGVDTRVLSALNVNQITEPYIRRRAIRHLEKGRVIILAAGTGNPYFTTDTAAALRALEIKAEAIFKATKVDGVYDSDPVINPKAKRFDTLSYREVLKRDLKVMDSTAVSLCMDNKLPIIVFDK